MSASRTTGLLTVLLVALGLPACGGSDGPSQQDVDRARREGRESERLAQLKKQTEALQQKLDAQRKSSAKPKSRTTTVVQSAPAPSAGPSLARGSSCGGDLSVGANTSCAFASNVREAYNANGPGAVEVSSPVTGRSYTMYCSGASPHVCTGGNNASVYFP